MAIVGVPDIDRLIIQQLDDDSVASVCCMSNYINEICNLEFWITRFYNKYGLILQNVDLKRTYLALKKLNAFEIGEWAIYNQQFDLLSILDIDTLNQLLPYAAKTNLQGTKQLLLLGANPSYKKSIALYNAIIIQSLEIVSLLLEAGAGTYGRHGNILQAAVTTNNVDIVKLLMEYGSSVYQYDEPLLFTALLNNNPLMFELLIKMGALSQVDDLSELLNHSVFYSDVVITKMLLDINIRDPYSLFTAVDNNDAPMVELLLQYDQSNRYDENMLYYVVENNYYEILDILLEPGNYDELLENALYNSNVDIVKVLLSKGSMYDELDTLFELYPYTYDVLEKALLENEY